MSRCSRFIVSAKLNNSFNTINHERLLMLNTAYIELTAKTNAAYYLFLGLGC